MTCLPIAQGFSTLCEDSCLEYVVDSFKSSHVKCLIRYWANRFASCLRPFWMLIPRDQLPVFDAIKTACAPLCADKQIVVTELKEACLDREVENFQCTGTCRNTFFKAAQCIPAPTNLEEDLLKIFEECNKPLSPELQIKHRDCDFHAVPSLARQFCCSVTFESFL